VPWPAPIARKNLIAGPSWNDLVVAGNTNGLLVVLDTIRPQLVANLTLRE